MRNLNPDLAHVRGVPGSYEFGPAHTNHMLGVWLRSAGPHARGTDLTA